MGPAPQAGDLGGHTTGQESSWGGKFFFMTAFLGTPSTGWKPSQGAHGAAFPSPQLRGLALKGGSGRPRVQVGSLGAGACWWL